MRSVTTNRFHYILNGDGVEELFDLTGAGEAIDLAGDPTHSDDLVRLRALVDGTPSDAEREARPGPRTERD